MSEAYPARLVWPAVAGSAVNALSTSMIATAIVPITKELEVTPAAAVSLVTVLYVASAVVQPLAGAVADRVGARTVFIAGMAVVGAAGFVGGGASGLGTLVLARVLTGIGTSAAYPSVIALLRERQDSTGVPVPTRVLGAVAVSVQIAAAVGLPLGGLLTAALGWRAILWINAPVGVALALAAWRWFPRRLESRARLAPGEFLALLDPPGALLFLLLVSALAVATVPDPRDSLVPYVVAGAALLALAVWERRAAQPFLDVGLVRRSPALGRTLLRTMVTFAAMYAYLYGVTQWLQDARGVGALAAALLLAPMGLLSVAVGIMASRRDAAWRPLLVGGGSGFLASILLMLTRSSSGLWLIVAATLTVGVLVGLTGVANQAVLLRQAPAGMAGRAAGMMRAASNVSAILASGLIAWWYPVRADDRGLIGIAGSMAVLMAAVLALTALDRRALRAR